MAFYEALRSKSVSCSIRLVRPGDTRWRDGVQPGYDFLFEIGEEGSRMEPDGGVKA